jgi:hypothetical protein
MLDRRWISKSFAFSAFCHQAGSKTGFKRTSFLAPLGARIGDARGTLARQTPAPLPRERGVYAPPLTGALSLREHFLDNEVLGHPILVIIPQSVPGNIHNKVVRFSIVSKRP